MRPEGSGSRARNVLQNYSNLQPEPPDSPCILQDGSTPEVNPVHYLFIRYCVVRRSSLLLFDSVQSPSGRPLKSGPPSLTRTRLYACPPSVLRTLARPGAGDAGTTRPWWTRSESGRVVSFVVLYRAYSRATPGTPSPVFPCPQSGSGLDDFCL